MSIRTKLRLSALVTIGLASLVALTLFIASRNMEEAARNDRFASSVIKDVSDLTSLSYAYLTLKDARPRVQWELKHAALGKVLSEHVAGSREQEILLGRLRSTHEQLKRLFDVLSQRDEKTPAATGSASTPYDELNEGITAQLLARAEMMANDASLFNRESERRMDDARRGALILILGSASLLIISAAVTSSLLARSIGGSISALQEGTQRIASGDLDYRVNVASKDEMNTLAGAFNDMAAKLKSSHEMLEHEVAEQKRAREALRLAGVYTRSLIEASLDPLVTIDPEGRISDVNAATALATGYAREELIGTDFSDVFHRPGESPQRVPAGIQQGLSA